MVRIITDSASDLQSDYAAKHNIDIVPLFVTFDGETYMKDELELSRDDFYERVMTDSNMPKTSLPGVQDFADSMEKYVKEGDEVIVITISTSLSGSYNSAKVAREQVLEDYPDAKISVVNSTTNTITQGLFVNEAVRMRDAGLTYEEIVLRLGKITDSTRIFFTIANLDYMLGNGRIGKLASLLTNKIKIRPIIIMKDNEIGIGGISRTRAGSLNMSIEQAKKFLATHNKDDYNWGIGYGYDLEEGKAFIEEVKETLGLDLLEEHVMRIGAVTICHTGPHPIGIGCVQKFETLVK